MLRFLFFSPCINYSFTVFHPSRPVLFKLRSTLICHRQIKNTKNFESPLPNKAKKGVSAVLFATEPHCLWFHPIHFQAGECGKLSQIFQVLVAHPIRLLKTTLNRLHIVQFLWYFQRGRFLHSNNLILLCSHNVVFLLQVVLPQEQRLVVKKGSPDGFQPLRQNIRITNRSRQHSFWRLP